MKSSRTRPEWANRLRRAREARNWTQEEVVRLMRAHSARSLPDDLLNSYKRYERGKHFPATYASLLAGVFRMEVESLFGCRPPARRACPAPPLFRAPLFIAPRFYAPERVRRPAE